MLNFIGRDVWPGGGAGVSSQSQSAMTTEASSPYEDERGISMEKKHVTTSIKQDSHDTSKELSA